jgi:hypothetical protein
MKKILLLIPFLWGCEKIEFISQPSVAGEWVFTDYIVTVEPPGGSESSQGSRMIVQVIPNDTICVNSFSEQSFVSGGILMKQNFNLTPIDRRFIKGQTRWNFSGSYGSTYFPLHINFSKNYLDANFLLKTNMREYSHLVITNNNIPTNYTFFTDGIGTQYSRKLTLISPTISTDLYLSDGRREKGVNVKVTLIFTRN